MEAIEARLGQLSDLKTATGLRALRKHMRQRDAAAGHCALDDEKVDSRTAAAIAALNGTAADQEEEEEEEEGTSDDDEEDDAI
jgi:hypothetical protein